VKDRVVVVTGASKGTRNSEYMGRQGTGTAARPWSFQAVSGAVSGCMASGPA